MAKAIKVVGIGCASVVGVAVVGAFGAWLLLLRAPSPEAQCDHVIGLMKKESGVELGPKFRVECLRDAEKGEHEGLLPYAEKSKCIVGAQTLTEAERCGKKGS
jgi:hypothetical protein